MSAEVQDMSTAPKDGEIIELLFEGDWFPCHWSSRADDGSPYGTTGWADSETGYFMQDAEGWRPAEEYGFVDEYEMDQERIRENEAATAFDRKEANRALREKSAENRKRLESQLLSLTGEDVSGQKIKMVELRRMVSKEHSKRSMESFASIMKSFFG